MKAVANKRNSNIELLRIIATMAVIMLHINYYPSGGGLIENVDQLTSNIFIYIEGVCVCAVNVFLMIGGYYTVDKDTINTGKLLGLLIQVSLFRCGFTLLRFIMGDAVDAKRFVIAFLPVNYYVVLYCALMIISPYINLVIRFMKNNEKVNIIFLSIVFTVFSIYPTLVELLETIMNQPMQGLSSVALAGSGSGYTIVNFILVYIIGAEIRVLKLSEKISIHRSVLLFASATALLMLWHVIFPNTAWEYSNPIVIIEAALVLVIFLNLEINSRIVNRIARASYTCYLINTSLLGFINFKLFSDMSTTVVFSSVLLLIFFIYIIAVAVSEIYTFIMRRFLLYINYKMPIIDVSNLMN